MSDSEERMQRLVADALRTEPSPEQYEEALARLMSDARYGKRTLRLLHAAMGLVTEAGEFLDALKKHIFYGKKLDYVNLVEELGDSSWYERIACDALEVRYLEMLDKNVTKLRARFPGKFSGAQAIDRDVANERAVLEADFCGHHNANETICTLKLGHTGPHSSQVCCSNVHAGILETLDSIGECSICKSLASE